MCLNSELWIVLSTQRLCKCLYLLTSYSGFSIDSCNHPPGIAHSSKPLRTKHSGCPKGVIMNLKMQIWKACVYIYIYNASRNPPCWWLWRLWLWVVGGILWLWLLLLPQLCIPLVPQALLALPLAALNVASDQPCASSSDTSSKCLKHCSTASRLRSNEECHFCHHAMLAKDLETQIQMKSSEHIQGDPF